MDKAQPAPQPGPELEPASSPIEEAALEQVKVEHAHAQGGNAQSVFKPIDHSAAPSVLPTCGAFEPHEWKRNVCRNCFGTRLAHELPPPSEAVTPLDSNAEQARAKRLERRTIKVPHFETFENMHIIMGRYPPAPSPRGQAKAQHKPVPTTPGPNTGKMNEHEEEETYRLTEIESQLREAWQKISKLKAKLARKHKRLQEAENAGYTLRVRMDALLKEAAELERAEKQLRLEHAEAWKREKEFWIQEVQMAKKEASTWKAIAEHHRKLLEQPSEPSSATESVEVVESQDASGTTETQTVVAEESEAQTDVSAAYDEERVRKCQRIVRLWIARKRTSRFASVVRAYSASPHAKTQRRRFATIRELIQTERNYVEMIQHAIDHYLANLREKADFEAKTFQPEDIDNLFNNIEILAIISYQFLLALEQRFASFDNFTCYGDLILKFQMMLPLYSLYYRKYEETNILLLRLCESDEFVEILEDLQKKSTYNPMLALKVYLYRPCQRIPQYSLLLKQLLSYTPSDHVDYKNILLAADRVHKILELLNKRTKVEQSKRRLQEIQNKLLGYDKSLTDDRLRQFLGEDNWLLLVNVQRSDPSTNTRKLSNIKGFKSFVWRPASMHMDSKADHTIASNVKAQKVRVLITSDVLLFVKVKKNGCYRFLFSVPLAGAVVAEMNGTLLLGEGFDNPLMIRTKAGIERFFLFKNQAERRKWTEKLWAMILVLNEDGKIKPEVHRIINRGRHMRLTQIGMTNLMKAAMGAEADEITDGTDDMANIYDLNTEFRTVTPAMHRVSALNQAKEEPKAIHDGNEEASPEVELPAPGSMDKPSTDPTETTSDSKQSQSQPPAEGRSDTAPTPNVLVKTDGRPAWSPVRPRREASQKHSLRFSLRSLGAYADENNANAPSSSAERQDPVSVPSISQITAAMTAAGTSVIENVRVSHASPPAVEANEEQTSALLSSLVEEQKLNLTPRRPTESSDSDSDDTENSPETKSAREEIEKRRRKLKREIEKLEWMRQRDEYEWEQRYATQLSERSNRENQNKSDRPTTKSSGKNKHSSSSNKADRASPRRTIDSDSSSSDEADLYDLKDVKRGSKHYDSVWLERFTVDQRLKSASIQWQNEENKHTDYQGGLRSPPSKDKTRSKQTDRAETSRSRKEKARSAGGHKSGSGNAVRTKQTINPSSKLRKKGKEADKVTSGMSRSDHGDNGRRKEGGQHRDKRKERREREVFTSNPIFIKSGSSSKPSPDTKPPPSSPPSTLAKQVLPAESVTPVESPQLTLPIAMENSAELRKRARSNSFNDLSLPRVLGLTEAVPNNNVASPVSNNGLSRSSSSRDLKSSRKNKKEATTPRKPPDSSSSTLRRRLPSELA